MSESIKILFLDANPRAKSRLRLDKEFKAIDRRLSTGEKRHCFELVSEWAVTPSDLLEALLRHQPHILHFSGRGTKSQGIVLEDDAGKIFLLNKRALANLLSVAKDRIRIVVLNACYAKDQAKHLKEIVDFTVVINEAIGDEAAIVFASYFYQGLVLGRSVKTAFELGKNALDVSNIPESQTPMLFVRYGVNPNESILLGGEHLTEQTRSGSLDNRRKVAVLKFKKSRVRGVIGLGGDEDTDD